MTMACLFFLRHINSPIPQISYIILIGLSVSGSVRYFVRKPCCTVIIDLVSASCKTQRDFCSPENIVFSHNCFLVEKQVTKPWHKTQEENVLIYSFHWHAFLHCGRVFLWATDFRNPRGNYETRCISFFSLFKSLKNLVSCGAKAWLVSTLASAQAGMNYQVKRMTTQDDEVHSVLKELSRLVPMRCWEKPWNICHESLSKSRPCD
jgi:hypothetical protein